MTLNRFNPRRDGNEPEIRKRFAHHGWHTEQLSGKGMPDLLCWPFTLANKEGIATWGRRAVLVDVKEPTGKPTAAQVLKWQSLKDKGIPVYVARTEADVDAIVAGIAEPWAPGLSKAAIHNGLSMIAQTRAAMEARPAGFRRRHRCGKDGCRELRPCVDHDGTMKANKITPRPKPGDAAKARAAGQERLRQEATVAYFPPRTLPDVAKEAEVFAPAPNTCAMPRCLRPMPCPIHT